MIRIIMVSIILQFFYVNAALAKGEPCKVTDLRIAELEKLILSFQRYADGNLSWVKLAVDNHDDHAADSKYIKTALDSYAQSAANVAAEARDAAKYLHDLCDLNPLKKD